MAQARELPRVRRRTTSKGARLLPADASTATTRREAWMRTVQCSGPTVQKDRGWMNPRGPRPRGETHLRGERAAFLLALAATHTGAERARVAIVHEVCRNLEHHFHQYPKTVSLTRESYWDFFPRGRAPGAP